MLAVPIHKYVYLTSNLEVDQGRYASNVYMYLID
jgi:hypothetical protein